MQEDEAYRLGSSAWLRNVLEPLSDIPGYIRALPGAAEWALAHPVRKNCLLPRGAPGRFFLYEILQSTPTLATQDDQMENSQRLLAYLGRLYTLFSASNLVYWILSSSFDLTAYYAPNLPLLPLLTRFFARSDLVFQTIGWVGLLITSLRFLLTAHQQPQSIHHHHIAKGIGFGLISLTIFTYRIVFPLLQVHAPPLIFLQLLNVWPILYFNAVQCWYKYQEEEKPINVYVCTTFEQLRHAIDTALTAIRCLCACVLLVTYFHTTWPLHATALTLMTAATVSLALWRIFFPLIDKLLKRFSLEKDTATPTGTAVELAKNNGTDNQQGGKRQGGKRQGGNRQSRTLKGTP